MTDNLLSKADKKNRRMNMGIGAAAAAGILGLEAVGHKGFNNLTTVPKAFYRAGLGGLMTYGAMSYLNNAVRRPAKKTIDNYVHDTFRLPEPQTVLNSKEVTKVSNVINRKAVEFYDGTGFREFMKVASEEMGKLADEVPTDVAYDAYMLYRDLPVEDRVETVCGLHEIVDAGFDKIAVELVAANVLREEREKHASVVGAAKAVGSAAGKAAFPAMMGASVVSSANDKLDKPAAKEDHPSGFRQ